jgi:hypothetical protein
MVKQCVAQQRIIDPYSSVPGTGQYAGMSYLCAKVNQNRTG